MNFIFEFKPKYQESVLFKAISVNRPEFIDVLLSKTEDNGKKKINVNKKVTQIHSKYDPKEAAPISGPHPNRAGPGPLGSFWAPNLKI